MEILKSGFQLVRRCLSSSCEATAIVSSVQYKGGVRKVMVIHEHKLLGLHGITKDSALCVGDRIFFEKSTDGCLKFVEVCDDLYGVHLDFIPVKNVNHILLLFNLAKRFSYNSLNLYLAVAEASTVDFSIVISNSDRVSKNHLDCLQNKLQRWGYSPYLFNSSLEGEGEMLRGLDFLKYGTTLLLGPPMSGKSLFRKSICQDDKIEGLINTSSFYLSSSTLGGFIVDSPGSNNPKFTNRNVPLESLFPELRAGGSIASLDPERKKLFQILSDRLKMLRNHLK